GLVLEIVCLHRSQGDWSNTTTNWYQRPVIFIIISEITCAGQTNRRKKSL
ncbi:hypothetical protein PanWU01x14_063190, partial [Parasponia andersonii]